MTHLSVINLSAGLLILLGGCAFWGGRSLRRRFLNRAVIPAMTTFLLGLTVIIAHLLIAKWMWQFSWARVAEGTPLVAIVAIGIGYSYFWSRPPSEPVRDSEIVDLFDVRGRADLLAGEDAGQCLSAETALGNKPHGSHCKSPPVRVPFPMTQKRCKRTQKKSCRQLPKARF